MFYRIFGHSRLHTVYIVHIVLCLHIKLSINSFLPL